MSDGDKTKWLRLKVTILQPVTACSAQINQPLHVIMHWYETGWKVKERVYGHHTSHVLLYCSYTWFWRSTFLRLHSSQRRTRSRTNLRLIEDGWQKKTKKGINNKIKYSYLRRHWKFEKEVWKSVMALTRALTCLFKGPWNCNFCFSPCIICKQTTLKTQE